MTTTKPLCLTGGAHVMYCIAAVLLALLLPVQTMADEAWAEYNSNDSTLTFKYGTKPESSDEGITLYALNVDTVSPGWNDEALNIKSVVLEPSFANARPTSCHAWFKNCANLTSLDLTNLNTEAVTNMSWMFGIDNNCYDEYGSALESITWPETLDTKNVKDMSCMFYNCDSLTTLDVSKFNTENVENMTSMFDCCSGLETLEVTNFNTAKVRDMNCMFACCSSLTTLNVSNFNTEKVTNMYSMFYNCSSLTTLNLSNFNTESVEDMSYMFACCASLTTLNLSNFNTESVEDMSYMFACCASLTTLNLSNFNTESVEDMSYMFACCASLTTLNLSNFNTESVEDMSYMFACCASLTTLNLSNFNTESVEDMSYMFEDCSGLTTLNVSSFNTANVTDMSRMFNNCSSLTSLDLSGFNTENVKGMVNMFAGCSSLTSLNVSNFNTANVMRMDSMFAGCSSLTSLNVSNFNTANVMRMDSMFAGCSSLTSLNVSNFNTANVMRMDSMFAGCSSLTSLNVSNFNTANVWTMDWMFYRCSGLTSIDLTSFDTNNVKYMDYMFASCSKLATVYVGEKFFIKTAKEPIRMFDGCAEEGAEYYYIKTYYRVGDTKYELWRKSGTFSVDELVLEDGKDFVAHVPFTAATASYQRTMANRWGTLCLPFAVEASAVTGCTFYGLESVTDDLITLTLLDGTIEAGTPVFVNSSSGSINISASNADVVTTPAAGTESGWQLVGSYTVADVPDDGYIISNNKFWLASDLKNGSTSAAVKTKGLRAWLKAGATGSEARANTLDIFAGDDATSIDAMEGLADGTAEIYDTQGRRTDRLQKGLNIVKTGGATKKVMVK